ncbi:MAG TPA: cytochrome c [Xanthobacteraceae bacterium]
MSTRKPAAVLLLALRAGVALALGAGVAFAQSPGTPPLAPQAPNLGKKITEPDLQNWDIAILPDGTGLPAGHGTPAEGAKIFADKCAACHGDAGNGGVAPFYPALVGGAPLTNGIDTPKTIANYYAYATTVFDYTRRAMPYNAPRSLKDDEVYALTAYILSLNKLIGENDVMDAKTLPQVKMPNRDNFILPYPDRI